MRFSNRVLWCEHKKKFQDTPCFIKVDRIKIKYWEVADDEMEQKRAINSKITIENLNFLLHL